MRGKLMCLFVVGLVAAVCARGEIAFYVSLGGENANNGTKEAPFKTLDRALTFVREKAASMNEDVVVYVGGGTYRLKTPLRFAKQDSGRNGHSVVWKAVDGEKPVISGGIVVDGWTPDADGRWKARLDVADMRQLYVNGARAQRARGAFPEGGGRYGELQAIDADAGHTAPGEAMAAWRNQGDIEFGYPSSWSHMICKVKSITPDGQGGVKIAMQQPGFFLASRKEGRQAEMPEYIENAFELLDEPGEWYFDKPAKTLYYLPRDGEDMTKTEAVVPVLETLMTLEGVENIRFEGLTFAEATWLTPNRIGHADVQANCTIAPEALFERDGWVVNLQNEYTKSPANVRLIASRNVRFERCSFTRLGGAGLDIEQGSQGNHVIGCVFQDISGSGVQIGDVKKQDHHPDDPGRIVKGNRVENCVFRSIGAEYEDSVGVFGGYTQETVIAHNEFAELPYSAISIGWGWGEQDSGGGSYPAPFMYEAPTPAKDNRIEFNHIHDVMLKRDDGGAVYTLGNQPGTIIRNNHIHDSTNNPGGIYLDEGSGFIEVTGNLVYGVKTAMNYNNRNQDRINTCNEHDNLFDADPNTDAAQSVVKAAGLEEAWRDLLR